MTREEQALFNLEIKKKSGLWVWVYMLSVSFSVCLSVACEWQSDRLRSELPQESVNSKQRKCQAPPLHLSSPLPRPPPPSRYPAKPALKHNRTGTTRNSPSVRFSTTRNTDVSGPVSEEFIFLPFPYKYETVGLIW